ncbi:hypothetical protein ABZ511_15455 [Nocardia gamkensis]|uniref:Rv0361 family membrane protein n=1 Tax=Nocardia gamkensis TaxID=352869 RepID=UPI0033DC4DB1
MKDGGEPARSGTGTSAPAQGADAETAAIDRTTAPRQSESDGASKSGSAPNQSAEARTVVIKRDQTPSGPTRGSAPGTVPAGESASKDAAAQSKQGPESRQAAAAKPARGASPETAASDSTGPDAKTASIPQGAEGATVVMRRPQPPAGPATPAAPTADESASGDDQKNPPGSDDVTMAMPLIGVDDAKTVALPIQRPADSGRPGTDRVVASPAGPVPITKPPSTPRPASGPKQPGPHGPSAPPQHGPGVEETRPSPQRPQGRPRQVATAPSPADVQQTVPAQSMTGPRAPHTRPVAPPQRIPPAAQGAGASATEPARNNRLLLIAGGAVVLVVALVAVIVSLVTMSGDDSPEAQVRSAITGYTEALKTGDLEALRSTTCGPLHDFYQSIPSDQFAGVHKLSMERKNIPVVDSIDAIRITDATAIAQATVYTEADPAKRSARTFDLQRTDDGWKVCDPPASTQ